MVIPIGFGILKKKKIYMHQPTLFLWFANRIVKRLISLLTLQLTVFATVLSLLMLSLSRF